jgi:hypothetical protein
MAIIHTCVFTHADEHCLSINTIYIGYANWTYFQIASLCLRLASIIVCHRPNAALYYNVWSQEIDHSDTRKQMKTFLTIYINWVHISYDSNITISLRSAIHGLTPRTSLILFNIICPALLTYYTTEQTPTWYLVTVSLYIDTGYSSSILKARLGISLLYVHVLMLMKLHFIFDWSIFPKR